MGSPQAAAVLAHRVVAPHPQNRGHRQEAPFKQVRRRFQQDLRFMRTLDADIRAIIGKLEPLMQGTFPRRRLFMEEEREPLYEHLA
jgi:hypothetical protein